ncbi:MAG: peptidoglycan bridge formation glycyltransferase FemA/FemB family protein [Candidatus Levybacteria bacterium]|nr:peptidoglycan bridge formation glycyltransferase FemA/FemB family protein [Candidatus Levybacteria bacterium]
MAYQPLEESEKVLFNKTVTHPLQSYEWGTFRERTGLKVIRKLQKSSGSPSAFTLTIHPIPKTPYTIGYLPKGLSPDKELVAHLKEIGRQERCIFIQLEPNIRFTQAESERILSLGLKKAARALFTRFSFVLDLSKSEEEIEKNLHPKTRYNIKIAKKHNVTVAEKNTPDAFDSYLSITQETTKRQGFYAHSKKYHTDQWATLSHTATPPYNELSSHLLIANYNMKTLVAWIVFIFKDTLYYPYGASSSEHRETMASTLMMWEAIKYGKKMGLKYFDMWGALGTDPDTNDSWYGFHRFKQGFRPEHVEFVGSFDLVIHPILYRAFVGLDKIRWLALSLKK